MELTRARVRRCAREYEEAEPLFPVEQEQIETLPGAFAAGEYGWRDAEWVVQWYYRRYLGGFPDSQRRRRERAYGRNEFCAVRDAITETVAATGVTARIDRLTALEGVDVPIASGFLFYMDPGAFMVVGPREWWVIQQTGGLEEGYPDLLASPEYAAYLSRCRAIAEGIGCDLWTLYRAVWRIWQHEHPD